MKIKTNETHLPFKETSKENCEFVDVISSFHVGNIQVIRNFCQTRDFENIKFH